MDELSDEGLIAACAVGGSAALGAIYDRHHEAVYRFLSRAAGGHEAIDDLVQMTFIEVWRSAKRYSGKGSVRSWIFGIAANVVRHHVRGEVRRRTAHESMAECARPDAARPDDLAHNRQLVSRLFDAVAELPHDLRVAFVLCDLEGLPGVEAARALGVRSGTLWRRLHCARKALRASLEGRSE